MGATALVRLWLLNNSADRNAPTIQRLQNVHAARVASKWSVEIRSFQQTPFHAASTNKRDSSSTSAGGNNNNKTGKDARGQQSAPTNRMWHLTSSEFPDLVFVYIEAVDRTQSNASNETLAKITRSLFVTSTSIGLLLAKANLPRPLGERTAGNESERPSAGGDAAFAASAFGPGAWIPRGPVITIDGVMLSLPDQPGASLGSPLSPDPLMNPVLRPGGSTAKSGMENAQAAGLLSGATNAKGEQEWLLRIGELHVGAAAAARGSIAELECLTLEDSASNIPVSNFAQTLFADQARARTTTGAAGMLVYPPPLEDVAKELGLFSADAAASMPPTSSQAVERMRALTYMYVQALRFDGIL